MSIKRSFSSFLHLLSSQLLVKIIQIITLPIILRYYVPSEYGKVSLYLSIYNIIVIFTNFTESAKIRFGREEYENTKQIGKTFWGISLIKFPIVILGIILIFIFSKEICVYTGLSITVVYLLATSTMLTFFSGSTQLLFAQEKFKLASAFLLIRIVIRLLLVVLLVLKVIPPVAIAIILATILATFLVDISAVISVYKKAKTIIIDWKWIRSMLIFSLPFLIHIAGAKTVGYIDSIVIRKYLPFSEVGIYSVAYRLYEFMIIPFMIVNTIVSPRMISLYTKKKMDKIKWFYERFSPIFSFFIIQILTFGILFLPLFIFFVGENYRNSLPSLTLLLIPFAWTVNMFVLVPMFHSSKIIWPHVLGNVSMAITNVVMDFILIPKIGIIGAAIGTLSASFVTLIVHTFFFKRLFKIKPARQMYLSVPFIIILILSYYQFNIFIIISVYIILTFISWFISLKIKLFDEESMKFINELGVPKIVLHRFNKFYRKLI